MSLIDTANLVETNMPIGQRKLLLMAIEKDFLYGYKCRKKLTWQRINVGHAQLKMANIDTFKEYL